MGLPDVSLWSLLIVRIALAVEVDQAVAHTKVRKHGWDLFGIFQK